MKLEIVYQTDDFIIIYKPCGLSVHKDQSEIGLTTLLAEQLDVPQVWLVHRLDKVTSGLLILALNAESAAEFFRLFSEHHVQKTYLALSNHKPKKKQGLIIGDMQKARNGAWKLCPSKENPAITRFESVSCEPNLRLFILKPQTGKTHQLRVAMKSLGSPILGMTYAVVAFSILVQGMTIETLIRKSKEATMRERGYTGIGLAK
jgi:tRNA pseudouridine32 synthase / 23S rRNA pseudouridine746 synthase